jgi:hypothetical protein
MGAIDAEQVCVCVCAYVLLLAGHCVY